MQNNNDQSLFKYKYKFFLDSSTQRVNQFLYEKVEIK